MRSEIRSLQARVRALQRKYAPQLAFIKLRQLAEDYTLECEKARDEHKPQPETHRFIKKIVKAGFRLRTFIALHKCVDRFRDKDAIPEPRDILLALLPYDWERINRHMPRKSELDQDVEERPWREWATAEA